MLNKISRLKNPAVISLFSGLWLTGCMSTAAMPEKATLNHNTVQQITTVADHNFPIKVVKDIAYGEDSRQRLDIYSPGDGNNHPVMIFAYGGAWHFGNRHEFAFIGKQFAKAGYTTVVIDYRHAPKHLYPDYVEDTATSMG